jgi:hypothetical protein
MNMTTSIQHLHARSLTIAVAASLLAGCTDDGPLAPGRAATVAAANVSVGRSLVAIRQATARYHDLDAAIKDGYVFLHGCETRPDEGPAGILYVHFDRLLDGVIDPSKPDALLYAPRPNGPPKLLGVELAIPYPMWTEAEPPRFMGAEFQNEDEFGVWGLHVWAWTNNPEGMFAESNPEIDCGD